MLQKSSLLKELGWDDALIKHFMIEDNEFVEQQENELKVEIFDTNSLTINYNTVASRTSPVITTNNK